ncbi:hypothetical protein Gobs01_02965 [Geodermatophilus obscurus DSM 43160]|uniref:Bifunctional DNA primase/polymerase n=2 Tax=Geodermatophilus obscurus TaxID=1861 RepID=D2SC66_GEOOG|nr:Bifunctional DNA primase/polymerase [Geodermatophilus obscurus DSM 43160]
MTVPRNSKVLHSGDLLNVRFPVPTAHDGYLHNALFYAACGLRVIPVRPGTKASHSGLLGTGWSLEEKASNDPEQITKWWTDEPFANIGIPQGRINQTGVIDHDRKHGERPRLQLAAHLRTVGVEVSRGIVVRTPFGEHEWYLLPRGGQSGTTCHPYVPGVDLQLDGTYVLAPPSQVRPSLYATASIDPKDGKPSRNRKVRDRERAETDAVWLPYLFTKPTTPVWMDTPQTTRTDGGVTFAEMFGNDPPALSADDLWRPTVADFLGALGGAVLPRALLADSLTRPGAGSASRDPFAARTAVPVEVYLQTGIPVEMNQDDELFRVAASCAGRGLTWEATFEVLRTIADRTPLKIADYPWDDGDLENKAQRAVYGKAARDKRDAEREAAEVARLTEIAKGWTL